MCPAALLMEVGDFHCCLCPGSWCTLHELSCAQSILAVSSAATLVFPYVTLRIGANVLCCPVNQVQGATGHIRASFVSNISAAAVRQQRLLSVLLLRVSSASHVLLVLF